MKWVVQQVWLDVRSTSPVRERWVAALDGRGGVTFTDDRSRAMLWDSREAAGAVVRELRGQGQSSLYVCGREVPVTSGDAYAALEERGLA